MTFYLGCPIWAYKDWVGGFYPEGTKPADFLREYARRLTAVEGNTTFYAVPAPMTLLRWVEETPETFRFCPKLPRTVSHAGKLMEHISFLFHLFHLSVTVSHMNQQVEAVFLQNATAHGDGVCGQETTPALDRLLSAGCHQRRI